MINFNYSGRKVLITGGTRGIGRAIAEAFLKAGAEVTVSYVSNHEEAKKFQQLNESFGEKLKVVQFDVSSFESVKEYFDTLEEENISLDVVINSAGVRRDAVLAMMKPEDWDRVLDVNLKGSYNISHFSVLNMMKKRYGRIIHITSPASHFGFQGQANYGASKAGQIGLMRSLSCEVAKRGITVNCLSPGFIDTDFLKGLNEKLEKEYKGMVPMKRFGRPEEVAKAALFLASEDASYVNGTTLEVTGGL